MFIRFCSFCKNVCWPNILWAVCLCELENIFSSGTRTAFLFASIVKLDAFRPFCNINEYATQMHWAKQLKFHEEKASS